LVGTSHDNLSSKPTWTKSNVKLSGPRAWTPDDPAVVAALDLVRWELALLGQRPMRLRSLGPMTDREDLELAELGALLRERNALDARLGRLVDRPASPGHIGEWIAARIFDIELEAAANAAGYDGHFTTGELAGRTVNVKTYGKREGMLAINPDAPLDYYLVFTGPKAAKEALISTRGTLRPFCIDAVYLFDAHRLHTELQERGVKFGVATSVRTVHWDEAEIYPRSNNPLLIVSEAQRRQLELFASA
jgi:hypothetical protein